MTSHRILLVALLGGTIASCVGPAVEHDGLDDSFVTSGKSDTGGVAEGSPEAVGVLALVNQASKDVLGNDVGLSANAARNIVAYRLGDDDVAGTADDERFDTLTELDAVPFVGPVAWRALLAYAEANGYVPASPPPPPDAAVPAGVFSGELAATCEESISTWSQTCFPWKPCSYPVTNGRLDRGTATLPARCSLAGDQLTCTFASTVCEPLRWSSSERTVTGTIAADDSFVLTSLETTGPSTSSSWISARIAGRVVRTGATTVVLDQTRLESGWSRSGTNDSTAFKNSGRKTLQASRTTLMTRP